VAGVGNMVLAAVHVILWVFFHDIVGTEVTHSTPARSPPLARHSSISGYQSIDRSTNHNQSTVHHLSLTCPPWLCQSKASSGG
jgi:hypothetical protein